MVFSFRETKKMSLDTLMLSLSFRGNEVKCLFINTKGEIILMFH